MKKKKKQDTQQPFPPDDNKVVVRRVFNTKPKPSNPYEPARKMTCELVDAFLEEKTLLNDREFAKALQHASSCPKHTKK